MADSGKIVVKIDGDTNALDKKLKGVGLTVKQMADAFKNDAKATAKAQESWMKSAFSAIEKAAGSSSAKVLEAAAKTKTALAGIGKGIGDIASKGLHQIARAAPQLTAAAGSALKELSKIGLEYNADVESYTSNLTQMLGSSEAGVKKIAELKAIASGTPFNLKDLAESTQTLLKFNVPAEQTRDTLQMLGDVSMGNGEKLKELSLVFGQVSSAGRLTEEGLSQFVSLGFNPLNEIAGKTGESMEQLLERMKNGAVSTAEVTQALQDATSAGGGFYKSAEEAGKSVHGMVASLKEDAAALVGEVFLPVSDSIGQQLLPEALGYVQQLSSAFKEQGTDGLIEAAGAIVSDIAVKIAEGAPQLINGAISIIESLLQGISDNAGRLASGAVSIMKALCDGLIQLMPAILQTGADLAAGLAQGLAQAVPLFKPLSAILTLVSENFKVLAGAAAVALATFIAFKIVSSLVSLYDKVTAALSGLKIAQVASTLAMAAFNFVANLNPVVLIATGVAALTAALLIFAATSDKSTEAEKARQKAFEDSAEAIDKAVQKNCDAQKAYDDSVESIKNSAAVKLTEIEYTERLADELLNLADQNGNVHEANKTRAQFILGELNKALGTEFEMTDNQIEKFGELENSIYDVINAEKARAISKAYEEMYNEAIKNEVTKKESADTAAQEKENNQKLLDEVVKEYIVIYEEKYNSTISPDDAVKHLTSDKTLDKQLQESYNNFSEQIIICSNIIAEYGQAIKETTDAYARFYDSKQAIFEGNYSDVINRSNITSEDRKAVAEMSEEDIIRQIIEEHNHIESLRKQLSTSSEEFAIIAYKKLIDDSINYSRILKEEYEKNGKSIIDAIDNFFKNNEGMLEEEIVNFVTKLFANLAHKIDANAPPQNHVNIHNATAPGNSSQSASAVSQNAAVAAQSMLNSVNLGSSAANSLSLAAAGPLNSLGLAARAVKTTIDNTKSTTNAPNIYFTQEDTSLDAKIRAVSNLFKYELAGDY